MFFDSSDVYYTLKHKEITKKAVIQATKDVCGFLFVGAFIDLPNTPQDIIGQVVNDNMLRYFTENIQEIFVNAYDDESIVIWRRPASAFGAA